MPKHASGGAARFIVEHASGMAAADERAAGMLPQKHALFS
jgi:hypothetical protein